MPGTRQARRHWKICIQIIDKKWIGNEKKTPERKDSGKYIPNSYDGDIHYSFDFAQQIHIPFDSLQPGPIYFLTPFKVSLFDIIIECC